MRACMDAGLVKSDGFAVDASVIEADASRYRGKTNEPMVCSLAPSSLTTPNGMSGQTATFTSLPKTPQPIGSPAARRAAVSASTRAVSRRMNWVLSHPPIVKFGRAAINCSAVRLASSGWPVS